MSTIQPVVDFLVIGAQKCGTTTLFKLLSQHPEIAKPSIKEPGYFLTRPYLKSPINTIKKYHDLYDKKEGQLAFEATVDYSAYPLLIDEIWDDIYDYNPKMKIIYIVRNPLDRIRSAHRFFYKKGVYTKEQRNINVYLSQAEHHINTSRYYYQITPYIQKFGRENIHIIYFEDLKTRPKMVMTEICTFLSISSQDLSINYGIKSNTKNQLNLTKGLEKKRLFQIARKLKGIIPNILYLRIQKIVKPVFERKISESDLIINKLQKERLASVLLPDIVNLEKLTGKDLTSWKSGFSTIQ